MHHSCITGASNRAAPVRGTRCKTGDAGPTERQHGNSACAYDTARRDGHQPPQPSLTGLTAPRGQRCRGTRRRRPDDEATTTRRHDATRRRRCDDQTRRLGPSQSLQPPAPSQSLQVQVAAEFPRCRSLQHEVPSFPAALTQRPGAPHSSPNPHLPHLPHCFLEEDG